MPDHRHSVDGASLLAGCGYRACGGEGRRAGAGGLAGFVHPDVLRRHRLLQHELCRAVLRNDVLAGDPGHGAVGRLDRRLVIDPLQRWASVGEKPDYAGLLTFAGVPYTQDAAYLEGVDVAIVGAPTDDLVSDRPGTRFGPRAIRAASSPSGPELETSVDAISELRVVDFGDAPVLPADPARSHAAIEATVAQVLAAGPIPVVIGGADLFYA